MRFILNAALALLIGTILGLPSVRAAITQTGDVSTILDPLGYGIPGQTSPIPADLTIGRTDTGGVFFNQQFEPGALINTGIAIIGRDEGSIGAVDLTDFFSDWLVGIELIVGQSGSATLDIRDSAKAQVGNTTYNFDPDNPNNPRSMAPSEVILLDGLTTVGEMMGSEGTITLSGIAGSRLVTADLIVGDYGIGNLLASARASVITQTGYIGNGDASNGYVSISDLGTRWTVGDSRDAVDGRLIVGNLVGEGEIGEAEGEDQLGEGEGILRISNQGLVQVSDEVIIGPTGWVQLEAKGRLRILPTSEAVTGGDIDVVDVITNLGLISGDGFIDFVGVVDGPTDGESTRALTFVNTPTGTISNHGNAIGFDGTGSYNTGRPEKLIFNGNALNGDVLVNNGTISLGGNELGGGHMVFNVPVVNNFEIFAIDSTLEFPEGLAQSATGSMVLGGQTIVHGFITPAPLAQVIILNDSIVTVVGDIIFTEPFLLTADDEVATSIGGEEGAAQAGILSMGIGENGGALTITGNLDLTNAALELDLGNLQSPTIGDIFDLISVGGSIIGEFDNETVTADGHRFDIGYTASSVFLTYAGLATGLAGDFDNDGDVDGRDFLLWQRGGSPTPGSSADLADWRDNFGSNGSLGANLASVPEPSAMVLMCSALACCLLRRK